MIGKVFWIHRLGRGMKDEKGDGGKGISIDINLKFIFFAR